MCFSEVARTSIAFQMVLSTSAAFDRSGRELSRPTSTRQRWSRVSGPAPTTGSRRRALRPASARPVSRTRDPPCRQPRSESDDLAAVGWPRARRDPPATCSRRGFPARLVADVERILVLVPERDRARRVLRVAHEGSHADAQRACERPRRGQSRSCGHPARLDGLLQLMHELQRERLGPIPVERER